MRPLTLALCAGFALSPLAAVAAPGGVTGDVRCLMAMAAMSGSQDANQSRLGQIGVVYFAGRVKAQDPSYDFAARLKPVAVSMTRENIVEEAKRCGPNLTATLRELDAAQKTFPQPKPAAAPGAAAKPPAKSAPTKP